MSTTMDLAQDFMALSLCPRMPAILSGLWLPVSSQPDTAQQHSLPCIPTAGFELEQGAECYEGNKGVSDRFQRLPEVVGEITRDTQDNWEEVPYEAYRESAGSIVLRNEKIGNDPDGYINVEMVKSIMICP